MKTRTDLLNHLADKYKLERYLEIGVQNPSINFDKIRVPFKIGIDPNPAANATICKTSDEFFSWLKQYSGVSHGPLDNEVKRIKDNFVVSENVSNKTISLNAKFDLIFIDGLHTAEQVKKDFENALKILSPDGFIVLHDCNPEKEEHTIVPRPTERGHWNGDVWKFAVAMYYPKVTVDIDNGCMVFCNNIDLFPYSSRAVTEDWNIFNENRKYLLNLISWDEFVSIGSHV
jgi:hypothetical protein